MEAKIMAKREPGEIPLAVRLTAPDRSDASKRGADRSAGTVRQQGLT